MEPTTADRHGLRSAATNGRRPLDGCVSFAWALLAVLVLLSGCLAEADRDNVKKTTSTDSTPSGTVYYFDTDVAPIFEDRCGACHGHNPLGNSVSLTSEDYSNIVDKEAPNNPSYLLIDTANGSADSYIYMKVTGASGIIGDQMPYMTSDETDILQAWIDQDDAAAETAP